ncbi:Chromosome maintenance protein [Fragilaria crotonensis]|nr:Chromosome maintenance protein [Fragilaria crotonensis]
MASQSQSQGDRTTVLDATELPNYDEDQALFAQFLQEHQIQISERTVDNLEDDDDLEPTAGNSNVRRVPCFLPLLQRIKDRNYPDPSNPTFVVEVPLSEIVSWDSVRGGDLVQRVSKNTMRYQSIFCDVIDKTLENLPNSPEQLPARDTIDVLLEQRLAQQASQQANVNNNRNQNPDGGCTQRCSGCRRQQSSSIGGVPFPPYATI